MNQEENNNVISIAEIFRVLIKRWIVIVLLTVVGAGAGFVYTYFTTEQQYTSSVMIYVNSGTISSESLGISYSTITANRSLVDTYAVILKSRTTLEEVIENAKSKVVEDEKLVQNYTATKLYGMVTVKSVNGTEIISISVTSTSAKDAMNLATSILEVFPGTVKNIINGSSAKIVDYASSASPVGRGLTKRAVIGAFVGFALAVGLVILFDVVVNDAIESVDWVKQNLKERAPLLSVIPDSNSTGKHGYGYGKKYGYGYGYGYGEHHHSEDDKKDSE